MVDVGLARGQMRSTVAGRPEPGGERQRDWAHNLPTGTAWREHGTAEPARTTESLGPGTCEIQLAAGDGPQEFEASTSCSETRGARVSQTWGGDVSSGSASHQRSHTSAAGANVPSATTRTPTDTTRRITGVVPEYSPAHQPLSGRTCCSRGYHVPSRAFFFTGLLKCAWQRCARAAGERPRVRAAGRCRPPSPPGQQGARTRGDRQTARTRGSIG